MPELGKLITAMVTPFDERGEVDYEQAKRLALALLNSGSDGVVVSGTTGEAPTLSKAEKLRLFAEVKEAVGRKGTVIAGTGTYNTAESVELTREAEGLGVNAILLVVPYYNRPPQDGLYEHFKTIAQATHLPCILYNVPSRTVTNLAAETVLRLSQIDNIVGVKDASGNFDQIGKIIQGARKDFLVYSGNDSDTLFVLSLGGYGIISVASHLVGLQIKRMLQEFEHSDTDHAAEIHHQLMPLINALFLVANPIPLKYALNKVGFSVGRPRLPLVPPDAKTASAIDAVLKNYTIDLPLPAKA